MWTRILMFALLSIQCKRIFFNLIQGMKLTKRNPSYHELIKINILSVLFNIYTHIYISSIYISYVLLMETRSQEALKFFKSMK